MVSIHILLAYLAGIIILFVVGRVFVNPMKIVLKLVYSVVIGAIVLIVINLVGNMIGFHIPLNVVSSITVGLLGIPGILLLVVLKFFLY